MDVLRWPIVGPFLRWRHARTTLQLALLAAAAVVVVHGFTGPDIGSANLATVLTWVHYRGLLVIALLAAGNLFCTGCPFIRVRDWGRRLRAPSWTWPARLRGKWIAIALFVAVLVTYEWFDLWALPRATAWLVLAYFGAALVVDLLFKGGTFCKHLCPIGQFNFVASTMSPLEVRIREQATCDACRTADCISGRQPTSAPVGALVGEPAAAHRPPSRLPALLWTSPQRGCELGLFLPAKVGNIDCTFCLDCVQACPHDNIAITTRAPGVELADDRRRSGIGRLSDRTDIAALAVLFVFAALLNAFAMTAPAFRWQKAIAEALGGASEAVALAVVFAIGLLVVPMIAVASAGALTRVLTGDAAASVGSIAMRFVYGLVPLGFSVWLAHYTFHLLTGFLVVVPVLQSAAIDATGREVLGQPLWGWAGMRPGAVFPIQLGVMLVGTIGSIAVVQLIAQREYPARALRTAAPWMAVVVALAAIAIWILFQPMEMRGTAL